MRQIPSMVSASSTRGIYGTMRIQTFHVWLPSLGRLRGLEFIKSEDMALNSFGES
jgi:hypothetical protein